MAAHMNDTEDQMLALLMEAQTSGPGTVLLVFISGEAEKEK
jgi:hypothetical protein